MGSGIGAVEMHALFPHALVVGGDVSLASLPQPVPPTCVFVRANVLEGLPFPDGQFTSTHQRLLVAAIPAHAWPGVVQELVRVTRPGGWIELVKASDVIQPAGPATRRLLDWFVGISRQLGFEMVVLRRLGALLQQAGCVDVTSQDIPVPLGRWAGTTGQLLRTDLWHAFDSKKLCVHEPRPRPRSSRPSCRSLLLPLPDDTALDGRQHCCPTAGAGTGCLHAIVIGHGDQSEALGAHAFQESGGRPASVTPEVVCRWRPRQSWAT
uniref:Methyltransferase type 11 domain-containing protein n=1 Tax=Thermogemmatispora argillosa TaxID=2045280 RepID=A0A455T406_9CHLR|nr:hypothetical protein KTA_03130 [Thermogemmatispora argillosa]